MSKRQLLKEHFMVLSLKYCKRAWCWFIMITFYLLLFNTSIEHNHSFHVQAIPIPFPHKAISSSPYTTFRMMTSPRGLSHSLSQPFTFHGAHHPTVDAFQSTPSSALPSIISITMNASTSTMLLPTMTAIGTTSSLILSSLKRRNIRDVNAGFTSIQQLQQVASQRHVVIGVHTIIGLQASYVEKLLGLNSTLHDYRIERMDRPEADCWMGSVFEYFDALVTTDSYFTIMFRQNRDCYLGERKFKSLTNVSSDINLVNIGPYEVLMLNSSTTNDFASMERIATQALYAAMAQLVNLMFIPLSFCNSFYISHDYAIIRAGYGFVNLTEMDSRAFSIYFQNPMNVNHTYYQLALQQLKSNITTDVFDSLKIQTSSTLSSSLSSMIFPASCYSCSTSQCMWEDRNSPTPSPQYDPIAASTGVFIGLSLIFYWPLLILFRNKPSIRKRLIIPYACPILLYIFMVVQLFEVAKPCFMFQFIVIYFTSAYSITIYYTIMARFLILRNLYNILKKCKNEQQVKAVKFLVSKTCGITAALVLGFIVACVVALVPIAAYRQEFFSFNSQYVSSMTLSLISITFAAISLLIVLINVILSIPTIKAKGILYFLFFDDPLYLRFDSLFVTMNAILISVSLFTNANQIPAYNGIISFINLTLGFMYFGGVALIFELLKLLFFKAPKEQEELDKKLADVGFMTLLKEFAEKEMSLENIYFYEKVKEMEKKSLDPNPRLSLSDLDFLANNFMKPFSKNEINFSHETKKAFYDLVESCKKNEDIRFNALREAVMIPLMINIKDTYMRLVRTNEYRKWETAKNITE
ncbi:hypothetical protein C9374_011221 [Naegleria lovaniensis]|uniref:RGS domain-containing protein n=1 Tax=Naegleria lovaniensis TaxID=51637 RepID=A0AA88KQI1_NAELO|nr:uncharacterized protein C9374_011221 [Naegleria lovaniensis]KAG2392496.1 hypothetical protein C9374_011221 [Naegleria lovaniensis]